MHLAETWTRAQSRKLGQYAIGAIFLKKKKKKKKKRAPKILPHPIQSLF